MNKNDFIFLGVKVTPDLTTVSYRTPDSTIETTDKIKKKPHPDLVEEIAKLNPILNEVFKNEIMTATGLALSKTAKAESISITGKATFSSGKVAGVSSEAFTKSGYYDFEDDLWDIKDNIAEEVYAFRFEGKNADTQTSIDMEGAEGEPREEEVEESVEDPI